MTDVGRGSPQQKASLVSAVTRFCLENKFFVLLLTALIAFWGIMVAPFDWNLGGLPRNPVPVDAIPDIGENEQIVFTEWPGRSPQDVEDQITYPLTTSLLGIAGIKSVRSYSYFGFSTIYLIFKENVDFYWSRFQVLDKLSSLPSGTLPEGVSPRLGPDATALGQVFWYTLEGRDEKGKPTGGWDLDELRSIQDWYVRPALMSAEGVSEVASVGGFVREYQIDVDPDKMRQYGVTLDQIVRAVRRSNIDVAARTIDVNGVEYVIRGLGFIRKLSDIENSVITARNNVPVLIKHVATVHAGPALRRGALDKDGSEAVGGVVVVRYGENPLAVIKNVKEKIREIAPGLPSKTLPDGRVSKLTIVPFYDRTGLIYETLGTLRRALTEEILVTIVVILALLTHLRASILISGLLPLAVLMAFIAMKLFGVEANIVALSGIAIAIGTMVDMGIVICENIVQHLDQDSSRNPLDVVHEAVAEQGGAVMTAVSTTIVSFLPVFTMTGAEGKLFKPLAYTKTFALVASIIVALMVIPPFAQILFTGHVRSRVLRALTYLTVMTAGIFLALRTEWWIGGVIISIGILNALETFLPDRITRFFKYGMSLICLSAVGWFLTQEWMPLGPEKGDAKNFLFVIMIIGGLLLFFRIFRLVYVPVLKWGLRHKILFLTLPLAIVLWGGAIWLGFGRVFAFVPRLANKIANKGETIRSSTFWLAAKRALPGLGKEFMPPLDEGSFLLMPTTMPHASIGECLDILHKQDKAIRSIPEVDTVVGKIGRVESPLDPAPISMIETIITYKPEYITDKNGQRVRFRYDDAKQEYVRDEKGDLIPDPNGRPYRQWRPNIKTPDDIWDEIVKASSMPGVTSAPKLQPIAARIVMLQSGMRAPMGVKIKGPSLEAIEKVGLQIEKLLKQVPSVNSSTVFADRIVGKPYLEIMIDRLKAAQYGIDVQSIQDTIEVAIGGRPLTTTVEGRERYGVRVRYMRELRDRIETIGNILVAAPDGTEIPLRQLARIEYVRGPQAIKSEDTFLVGYVTFDKKPQYADVDVVEECQKFLKKKIEAGELKLPKGVSYRFAGTYENQVRAQKTLAVILPVSLVIIVLILYFQFKSFVTSFIVFSGIFVAWAGGFTLLWLYGQPWFMDFSVFGTNMRELFQIHPVNLSVAVWVGFLALFGIASDDGVVITTFLREQFRRNRPESIEAIRQTTLEAGLRRVRPCLMTTATTILALIPVLTSTGRGADVMVPMAIPSFGGMLIEIITMFVVPILYCAMKEFKFRLRGTSNRSTF